MSFGPDLDESYRRAAALADAILKGSRSAFGAKCGCQSYISRGTRFHKVPMTN